MGMVLFSIWRHYSGRLLEPQYYGEEANEFTKEIMGYEIKTIEEFLSEAEKNAGEDESFREHVISYIEKCKDKGLDQFWDGTDKRIYNFLCKNMEAKLTAKKRYIREPRVLEETAWIPGKE